MYATILYTFLECFFLTSRKKGLQQLALKSTDIEKFLYLSVIRKNNVHLFHRLLVDHLKVGARLVISFAIAKC